jgi:hypothetical protein
VALSSMAAEDAKEDMLYRKRVRYFYSSSL